MNRTDPRWRKSSYSGSNGGGCVETGNSEHAVLVRDTTNRDGGTLVFTTASWKRFTDQVKRSLADPLPILLGAPLRLEGALRRVRARFPGSRRGVRVMPRAARYSTRQRI